MTIEYFGLILGFFAFLFLVQPLLASGKKNSWEITSPLVIDVDTIFSEGRKIRLHGIDAPEMDQAGGPAAKALLDHMLSGEKITVVQTGEDQYGRLVARLHTHEGDICRIMVARGYAVASFHDDYKSTQKRAERQRSGLWNTGGIIDPAIHRRKTQRDRGARA